MTLTVQGMACLGSFGAGAGALLRDAPLPAVREDGRAADADTSALKDRLPARALRQTDRFTRMALLCMLEALEDAGISRDGDLSGTGIILATGYGPATPTFAFLDSLLAHGEAAASPLSFSHSVQNIPAASLAMQLGLVCPCATFCRTDNPVAAGVSAARQWLEEARVRRVLFGAVDEHTPLLAQTSRRIAAKRRSRPDGREGARGTLPVSEGAAFFCFAPAGGGDGRGRIEEVSFHRRMGPDVAEIPASGSEGGDTVFLSGAVPRELLSRAGFRYAGKMYGNIPVAQAFDLIIALSRPQTASSGRARCCSFGARGEVACIRVRRADTREKAI
jgi:3-oxoacyl-[acyl-carrier-protein] synthase II